MKIPEFLKTETVRRTVETTLVIFLLLVIPSLPLGARSGGVAMLAFSLVGLILLFFLYGERLHSRHMLKTAALAAAVGAGIAVVAAVLTTHSH